MAGTTFSLGSDGASSKRGKDAGSNIIRRIFNSTLAVSFAMSDEPSGSQRWSVLHMLLCFLQLISFPFSSHLSSDVTDWKNTSVIRMISSTCGIGTIMSSYLADESVWLAAGLCIVAAYYSLFAFFVYRHYLTKQVTVAIPHGLQLLRSSSSIMAGFLYIPLLACFYGYGHTQMSGDGSSALGVWSGIIVIIIAALLVATTFLLVIGLYDSDPYAQSLLKRPHARLDMANFAVRTLLVFVFVTFHNSPMLLAATYMFCGVMLAYAYTTYLPYYDFATSRAVAAAYWLAAWIGLCFIVAVCGDPRHNNDAAMLMYLAAPVVLGTSYLCSNSRRQQISELPAFKLQSPLEVELKVRFFLLDTLTDAQARAYEQHNKELDGATDEAKLTDEEFATVDMWYSRAAQRMQESSMIYTLWATFHFGYDHNCQMGMTLLGRAQARDPRIDEQYTAVRFQRIAADSLTSGKDSLRPYVQYQSHLDKAKMYDQQASEALVRFWRVLLDRNPDLYKLRSVGAELNTSSMAAVDNYKAMMDINSSSPQDLRAYASFIGNVLQDEEEALRLLDRADDIDNSRAKAQLKNTKIIDIDIFDDRNGMITIDGTLENIGRIINVNAGISRLYGYTSDELIGRNIQILVPDPFSKDHDRFLTKYIETGKGTVIDKLRLLFGLHKNGHLIPLMVNVRQISGEQSITSDDGTAFIGAVQELHTDDQFMFVTPEGEVNYTTPGCISLFPSLANPAGHTDDHESKLKIDDVLPGIDDIHEQAMSHNGCTMEQIMDGVQYELQVWIDQLALSRYGLSVDIFRIHINSAVDLPVSHSSTRVMRASGIFGDFSASLHAPRNDMYEQSDGSEFADGSIGLDEYDAVSYANSQVKDMTVQVLQAAAAASPGRSTKETSRCRGSPHHLSPPTSLRASKVSNNSVSIAPSQSMSLQDQDKHRTPTIASEPRSKRRRRPRLGTAASSIASSSASANTTSSLSIVRRMVLSKRTVRNTGLDSVRWVMIITCSVVMLGAIINYTIVSDRLQTFNEEVDMLAYAQHRQEDIWQVAHSLRTLTLVQSGALPSSYETYARSKLKHSADDLYYQNEHVYLQNHADVPTPDVTSFANLNRLQPTGNVTEVLNGVEILALVISKAKLLAATNVQNITTTDPNVHFILGNIEDQIAPLVNATSVPLQEYHRDLAIAALEIEIALSISCVASVALVLIGAFRPAIARVQQSREKVLSLFLDVPRRVVSESVKAAERRLQEQHGADCSRLDQSFAETTGPNPATMTTDQGMDVKDSSLTSGHTAATANVQQQQQQHGQPLKSGIPVVSAVPTVGDSSNTYDGDSKHHGNATVQLASARARIYWKASVLFFVCALYFGGVLFWTQSIVSQQKGRSVEITWVGRRRVAATKAVRMIRELHIMPASQSAERSAYRKKIAAHVDFANGLHHDILYGSPSRGLGGSSKRYPAQDALLLHDACVSIAEVQVATGCATFHNGIMKHGLTGALEEFYRVIKSEMVSSNGTSAVTAALTNPNMKFLDSIIESHLDNALLASEYLYEEEIHGVLVHYIESRVYLLLAVLVAVVIVYNALYAPVLAELRRDTSETRAMLLTLPASVMHKVKSIRVFLMNVAESGK
jgi:PAS domain S-box-containing protein